MSAPQLSGKLASWFMDKSSSPPTVSDAQLSGRLANWLEDKSRCTLSPPKAPGRVTRRLADNSRCPPTASPPKLSGRLDGPSEDSTRVPLARTVPNSSGKAVRFHARSVPSSSLNNSPLRMLALSANTLHQRVQRST
eukprot:TRINITY_DN18776_c0_g1_i1.p1 TRINITY_DN18776_c0_g1~~TRINITY_DN18776_c0_g1_i1.p1  ORF type:complete len:137 (+),score=16.91 TRINITY_DN18776_c0_g1_i1:107-517(+)